MNHSPISPRTDDTANRGMDAALVVAVLAGVGFLLDRWLGTTPWLTIAFSIVAAVGVFVTLKYRYVESMTKLEAERANGRGNVPVTTEDSP